jgi:AGZA family xanthine/uracil permease-like MFS transporter
MGLNAFFTFNLVGSKHCTWEIALGAVFLSSVLLVLISVTRLREWMLDSITVSLRLAMSRCGLILRLIGLRFTGIIIPNPNPDNALAPDDLSHFGFGKFGPEAPCPRFCQFLNYYCVKSP